MNIFTKMISKIKSIAPVAQLKNDLPTKEEAKACGDYWMDHWTQPILLVTDFLKVYSLATPRAMFSRIGEPAAEAWYALRE